MVTKEKEVNALKDKIATILFTDKKTREYTESVIAASIGIPKEIVKDNLVLLPPKANANVNTQYSEVDALYENNKSIINIEINYFNYKTLDVKNMKYVCHLFINQLEINKKRVHIKPIYQININNFDIFKKNKFIYRSYLMDEEFHIRRNDYINIIDINIDFLRKMSYTEIKEKEENSLERLLYIFACNDKSVLEKLYRGDNIMTEVSKRVSALTEDVLDGLYYNRQELIREGAYEAGVEEGKIEIAKKLKAKNYDIKEIQELTGLSVEEINNL